MIGRASALDFEPRPPSETTAVLETKGRVDLLQVDAPIGSESMVESILRAIRRAERRASVQSRYDLLCQTGVRGWTHEPNIRSKRHHHASSARRE
jgi:hypothetical protein